MKWIQKERSREGSRIEWIREEKIYSLNKAIKPNSGRIERFINADIDYERPKHRFMVKGFDMYLLDDDMQKIAKINLQRFGTILYKAKWEIKNKTPNDKNKNKDKK